MKRFVKENSLSLFFLTLFLMALLGQAISGHNLYNEEALQHKESTISFWRYLTSSDFGQAVMENWQSEYLQFALFTLATVWLVSFWVQGVKRGKPDGYHLLRLSLLLHDLKLKRSPFIRYSGLWDIRRSSAPARERTRRL